MHILRNNLVGLFLENQCGKTLPLLHLLPLPSLRLPLHIRSRSLVLPPAFSLLFLLLLYLLAPLECSFCSGFPSSSAIQVGCFLDHQVSEEFLLRSLPNLPALMFLGA